MATNPLHFLASRTQAQAFRAGVGRWMRRRAFFTGMYTFLAHKAKNGISDQCLEHIAGFAVSLVRSTFQVEVHEVKLSTKVRKEKKSSVQRQEVQSNTALSWKSLGKKCQRQAFVGLIFVCLTISVISLVFFVQEVCFLNTCQKLAADTYVRGEVEGTKTF